MRPLVGRNLLRRRQLDEPPTMAGSGTPSILIVQTNCDLIENWSVWTSRMPILELGAATLVVGFAIIVTSDESDGASKAAEKALEAARRLPHGAARIEVQHAP